MDSLTWQALPPYLLDPVLDGHLTLVEAAQLWDHQLMGLGQWGPLPVQLMDAAGRLLLREMDCRPTKH
jgi:hypothetical protein